jgi:translation initiation factor IF-2
MFNPNDNSFFWDDAGFLAWLGIPVEEKKKEEKKQETPVITVEEVAVEAVVETPSPQQKVEVPQVFGNAKVIRRSESTPEQKPSVHKKPSRVAFSQAEYKSKDDSKPQYDRSRFGQWTTQEWSPESKAKQHADIDNFITAKSESAKAWRNEVLWWRGPRKPGDFSRWPHRGGPREHKNDGKLVLGGYAKKWAQQQQATKQEKVYKVSDSLKKKTSVVLPGQITVKEFSEKMWVPLPEVMKVLLSNKIILPAQANIDFDTASLVAVEFDVTIEKEETKTDISHMLEGDLNAILAQDKDAGDVIERAPIVTIMGHVDHGKTKLLDYLRKTDVVKGEAGGITQSIGASQVVHHGKKITFIDTPGHELFTSLRARGAKITNIAIIVVAADDGVKQQTIEAINHAKDAWVQIIVAITKADKWLTKIEEIKGQLAQQGLTPEDRWGDIMLVPCSAVTGLGIDDLLDAILLQTEMMELRYSPSRRPVATVLEAHKDAKQWVLSTILVMTGTMKVGDVLVAGTSYGRVRKMMNRKGESIKTATGGDPIMILWLNEVPEPGKVVEWVASEKDANKKIEEIKAHDSFQAKVSTAASLLDHINKGEKVQLKLILKADSFGSLEALKYAAQKVELPEGIELKIVHHDVGAITDSDLIFAKAAEALVIGFNVSIPGALKKRADQLRVTVKEYDIIYEFIDFLTLFSQGMIEVEKQQVIIGNLQVLGTFFRRGKEMIIWGKVLTGWVVKNNAYFRVFRGEEQLATGQITSLQRNQESVGEVREGYECGMKVRVSKKIELDDRLEFFIRE